MLRRERRPVQLIGENAPRARRLVEREAPLVALLDLALHAPIEPGEDDIDRRASRNRLREQRRELDSPPQPRPDRPGQPRLADRPRLEERTAVPGALHRRRELDRRARAKLVERERERPLDGAAQLEPPGRGIDQRNVVVDQEVVEPHRRDGPAERLEQHRVVARRKTELLDADPGLRRDGHSDDRSAPADRLSTPRASPGRDR